MANLDPAVLQQFLARNGGGSGGTNYTGLPWIDSGDWRYEPVYQQMGGGPDEGGGQSLIGYNQFRQGVDTSQPGAEYAFYDPQGQFSRYGTTKDSGNGMDLLAMGGLAALTMGYGLPALMGSGAAGAAGPGMAGWGMDLGAGGLGLAPGEAAAIAGGAGAAGPGMAGWGMDLGTEGLAGTVGTGGVAPAASPSWLNTLTNALPSGASSLLGPAATALGAAAGAQGTQTGGTTSRQLDPRLDAPVFGDLVPRTQGLLASQMPQAAQQGAQLSQVGSGLLGRPVAGNGVGQVTLDSPATATNPYLGGMADDIGRRTQEMLGQNNLSIQGNAVATGGLGGSRQGVAQGTAAGKAADYLSGNLANLYGQQYSADQNRALQKYGQDQGFFTSQRGQDLSQLGIGSGLIDQGQQLPWAPLTSASDIYKQFSGLGTETGSSTKGGGAMGALGGGLGAAQFAKNMGWLGNSTTPASSSSTGWW